MNLQSRVLRFCVSIAAFLMFGTAVAQLPAQSRTESPITIGVNRRVTRDASPLLYVEPHLSAHPTNANLLLGATGTIRKSDGTPGVAALVSSDGGNTWVETELPGLELPTAAPVAIDPWAAFGLGGRAYVSALAGSSKVRGGVGLYIFASEDAGNSWRRPVRAPLGRGTSYDHPSIAVNTTSGALSGRVYIVAGQGVATLAGHAAFLPALLHSIDDGRTFSNPLYLTRDTFNNQVGNVIVMPNGVVAAPHFEMQLRGKFLEHPRLWVTISTDGGVTAERTYLVRPTHGIPWPNIAVDASSGTHRGRLYLCWMGLEGDEWVYAMTSDDQGETWSDPVRVAPSTPGGRPGQRNPMIAVNSMGVVLLSWPDAPPGRPKPCFHLWASASVDGGRSFLAPTNVSSRLSCPEKPANQISVKDYGSPVSERWSSGGDYHGLTAAPDGSFHLLWADSRDGAFEIWTAKVTVDGKR
jgi:hypothetical protein